MTKINKKALLVAVLVTPPTVAFAAAIAEITIRLFIGSGHLTALSLGTTTILWSLIVWHQLMTYVRNRP